MHSAENKRNRLSSELSEAHARYRKNDLIRSNLENEKNVEISKREIMEERAKHVMEDTERRVQLIEH